MPLGKDTAPIRPGEELNVVQLSTYLRDHLEIPDGPLTLEQFPGGHSNLTYLVRIGAQEYVLRRAPLGPVPPKAHDMAREYHVLEKVHAVFPAAPRVFLLCKDPAVIGSIFFLMERRRGLILRDRVPPELAGEPEFGARVSAAFLDCLGRMHAIDIFDHGLASLGKPEGFLDRQVSGWADRWARCKTDDLPEMEDVIRWLATSLPASGRPTLVHNDFKLDNVMLDPTAFSRVEAVLDWEMTTVGDPLADVGLTLCYWTMGSASAGERAGRAFNQGAGWYSRDEFITQYAQKTGRDCSSIGWYEVLGVFKLAVILQQIYFRYVRGQTHDERFAAFGQRVRDMVRCAAEMSSRA